ncbi:MAG: efflux RND transporter periplasmic adaptor subunit, partial [Bacteroidetes bacterium]|nr:efflux RND transporter periplasmic adaptor subunit [Bacteroidota bacterium]
STYEALKKTLELMHINTNTLTYSNIQTSIPVLSPCDGYLSQVKLSPGMFLNPSDVALSVVNTDHLHLELQVFESDLTKLKVGQAVSFNQSGSEDDWQEGEIYLISKTIDPDTRSTLVHVHFNNKEFNYLPGMFAKAKIYTATKTSLSLPESAIVKIDKEYYVLQVLRNEDEEIVLEKKPILVGAQENGYFEILNTSDFEKESFFLTKGAFQIIRE